MNTPASPHSRRLSVSWALPCLLLPVAGLCAQEAAPANPPAGEVVQLQTFTVTTAIGKYVESMTSAGSKLPMDMKELPNTVQVLNASFLNDTLAQNLDDVYGYVVGMTRVATGATDFNLRGFTSNGAGLNLHNMQVDGLPGLTTRFGSPNTSNIERVEVLKGPASMLYGLINPGGMINLVTKVPKEKRSTTVTGTLSTYAGDISSLGDKFSYSGTLDTTGPIDAGKHWLYRLIVKGEDRDSFRKKQFLHQLLPLSLPDLPLEQRHLAHPAGRVDPGEAPGRLRGPGGAVQRPGLPAVVRHQLQQSHRLRARRGRGPLHQFPA